MQRGNIPALTAATGTFRNNAFRHAEASRVDLEVVYDEAQLVARVQDNGNGFDVGAMSAAGCAGHFGLIGMQERVRRIQGGLDIQSRAPVGTVVYCRIPHHVAYQDAPTGRVPDWFRRVFRSRNRGM